MAFLDLTNLEKTFGANRVVKDFSLAIEKGEFVSLLGPSGCGKTTVLRMVAGFETPTSGTIHIDGHDVSDQRANQRNIGMMFQAYALFPNMTVADNVAFGLRVKGVSRAERDARVAIDATILVFPFPPLTLMTMSSLMGDPPPSPSTRATSREFRTPRPTLEPTR